MGALLLACGNGSSSETAGAGAAGEPKSEQHARPELILASSAVAPGDSVWLGIHFEIEPGWHLYWHGRNDTGFPITPMFTLPDGWRTGDVTWPAPQRKVSPGQILDHIYQKDVTLAVPVHVASTAEPGGTTELVCEVDWVVCREACIFESDTLSIRIPVVEADVKRGVAEGAARIERTLAERPVPPPDDAFRIEWSENQARLEVASASYLQFFPGVDCAEMVDPIEDGVSDGNQIRLRFKESEKPDRRLAGVLEVHDAKGRRSWYAIDRPFGPPM